MPLAELVTDNQRNIQNKTKIGSARVLTSKECIRTFEEKEKQKQLVQEEKQKRKEERGLKKDREK